MKELKQLSMAFVLAMMLATSTCAGIIDCPVAPPTPPPQNLSSQSMPGNLGTPNMPQGASSDYVNDVALTLLQSLLSVF